MNSVKTRRHTLRAPISLQREIGVSQRSFGALLHAGSNMGPADFAEGVGVDLARRKLLGADENMTAEAASALCAARTAHSLARLPTTAPTESQSCFKTHGGETCRPST